MCGICGFSGHANDGLLDQMGNAIRHRGPDGSGCYSDGRMNLCSRRLSIVDPVSGGQPVENEDSTVFAVWNGEIYNYRSLITELKGKGHLFSSDHSDSELIVHLYEEYGIRFVEKLNGMFAIALWDRNKECLYLICDRMGVKPLFYYYNGTEIVFASEIKSILLHPSYPKKINANALYSYFYFQSVSSPETAFLDIYALRPGTILTFTASGKKLTRYFAPSFSPVSKDSLPTAIEKIRFLLKDAVKLRLDADVEIGTFLSGGLDSGIVTTLASSLADHPLRSYCLEHESRRPGAFYQKEKDTANAARTANACHTIHTTAPMTASDMISELDTVIRCFDQPFAASASTWFLSGRAHSDVKAVLSGDGADELFGSYPLQQLAFPMQYFSQMKANGLSPADMDPALLAPFSDRSDFLANLYDYSGGSEVRLSYRMLNMTDDEKALFLSDEVFGELISKKQTLLQLREIFSSLSGADALNRSLEYFQTSFLPDQVLSYTDALSMAHGLEIRSPFLDCRLVDYVNSLPGSYKIRNGETKYLLKQAAKGLLPDDIIFQKKEGFIPPIHDWLRAELKEFVTDTLSPSAILRYPFLKADAVQFLLHKYYRDPTGNDYLADIIWNLVCFARWCELYV